MSKIKIERLQSKHKIHIEYSTKIGLSFANIVPERDGVVIRVFLKRTPDHSISSDEIKSISICVKPEKEMKKK